MKNILKGKTKDKRAEAIVDDFKALGEKKFEIKVSSQAKEIISNYGDNFPLEHFKQWFLKKMVVNGGHLHEYLATKSGFEEGIKEMK